MSGAGTFLAPWHDAVAARDAEALDALLADDVTLGAPPYWKRFEGRETVLFLLHHILHTFEDFAYHRQWADGPELALEFTARVGDLPLQGVDLLHLDAEGRLAGLDVLIRPHDAVAELIRRVSPHMVEFLARRAGS